MRNRHQRGTAVRYNLTNTFCVNHSSTNFFCSGNGPCTFVQHKNWHKYRQRWDTDHSKFRLAHSRNVRYKVARYNLIHIYPQKYNSIPLCHTAYRLYMICLCKIWRICRVNLIDCRNKIR